MTALTALILTNCTGRKRQIAIRDLRARSLPRGGYKFLADQWSRRIYQASKTYVAGQLYCGRAVTEAFRASKEIHGRVTFISAGLGVVTEHAIIPPYSLTSSQRALDSIASRLTEPYDPLRWWQALGKARRVEGALTKFLCDYTGKLILVSLPATYLALIRGELLALPQSKRRLLRIIGPRRSDDLDEELRAQWLPYDDRLDSPGSGFNGTASDFPQRALRHFVVHILPKAPRVDAARHAAMVGAAFHDASPYVRPRGRSVADEEVLAHVARLWRRLGGRRSLILRELRGTLKVACEQSRFKRLADAYAETHGGTD